MSSGKTFLSAAALLTAFTGVQAGLDLSSSSNIAVYWGQNSHGASSGLIAQQRLSYYCQNEDIDAFQLAFLTRINGPGGVPSINFANAGDNCTTFEGTSLLNCPQLEEDIKECQSLGKTILLSVGGATYTEGGFTSASDAKAGAKLLWDTFGPVPSDSSVLRPFGSAVIDGFDLDFESVVHNMVPFANQLRTYYSQDSSKQYYLTAAPQCPFPDRADMAMLHGAVYFDAIWVQFYNNYCGVPAYDPSNPNNNNFNFDTWDNWAHTISKNPNVKVFVGVPASPTAAGSGYVPASQLKPVIDHVAGFSSFGGVMMWDASQAYANDGFLDGVAAALGSAPTTPPPTTTSPPPGTTMTTTTKAPTPTSSTCPVSGGTCQNGSYACNGNQFGICNNGKWVMQSCSGNLICVQNGNSIYCNVPGSGPDTSCTV